MHTKKKAKEITFCFLILIELKRQNTNRPFLKSPRNGNWTKILRNWTFSIESYIVRRKDKKLKTKARKKMNTNVLIKRKKSLSSWFNPRPWEIWKRRMVEKMRVGLRKPFLALHPAKLAPCRITNWKDPPPHDTKWLYRNRLCLGNWWFDQLQSLVGSQIVRVLWQDLFHGYDLNWIPTSQARAQSTFFLKKKNLSQYQRYMQQRFQLERLSAVISASVAVHHHLRNKIFFFW